MAKKGIKRKQRQNGGVIFAVSPPDPMTQAHVVTTTTLSPYMTAIHQKYVTQQEAFQHALDAADPNAPPAVIGGAVMGTHYDPEFDPTNPDLALATDVAMHHHASAILASHTAALAGIVPNTQVHLGSGSIFVNGVPVNTDTPIHASVFVHPPTILDGVPGQSYVFGVHNLCPDEYHKLNMWNHEENKQVTYHPPCPGLPQQTYVIGHVKHEDKMTPNDCNLSTMTDNHVKVKIYHGNACGMDVTTVNKGVFNRHTMTSYGHTIIPGVVHTIHNPLINSYSVRQHLIL